MHRTLALTTSLAALVCALCALGCSSPTSSSNGNSSDDCSGTVSFSKDVIPVFQMSCTLSSVCHGQMGNSGEENLYLGLNVGGGTMSDIQAVYQGLMGATAKEDTALKLVAPSDPTNSYLWQKVSNSQAMLNSTLGSACMKTNSMCSNCTTAFGPCGATMPYSGEPLPASTLCKIQNWIQQGAQNN
jgi:hypothetical protein